MSFALWTFLGVIWLVGGIWDTTLRQASTDTAGINEIVASAQVLGVDDAGIDAGPLNAAIAIPLAISNAMRRAIELSSFDYVYLQGPLQMIRYVLLLYTAALVLMAIKDYGPTLVGAIRSLNPFAR